MGNTLQNTRVSFNIMKKNNNKPCNWTSIWQSKVTYRGNTLIKFTYRQVVWIQDGFVVTTSSHLSVRNDIKHNHSTTGGYLWILNRLICKFLFYFVRTIINVSISFESLSILKLEQICNVTFILVPRLPLTFARFASSFELWLVQFTEF